MDTIGVAAGVPCPTFYFRIEGQSIFGYVTAENYDQAVKILERMHLGKIDIKENGIVKGCEFLISREPVNKIFQQSKVQ